MNKSSKSSAWHYTPDLPVSDAPYFQSSIKFRDQLTYLFKAWKPTGLRFNLLILAVLIWTFFTPDISRAENFDLHWISEIFLRNLVLVILVAGGLHLFLFTFNKQADEYRYDRRPLSKNSKLFHFNNQVWDNMFWTLCSSVPIGTLWESLMLWGYANGIAPFITLESNPVWFLFLILLIPLWSGLHFYIFHRLLHFPFLYKTIHYWHHKNIRTGPWSGHAMHPVEHLGLYSDLAIYFVVPSHPIHVIFNAMLHTVGGPTSHCGYDKVMLGKKIGLELGDFFHQLHHRYVDCNYGTYDTQWDRIFGSLHDGTEAGMKRIESKRAGNES